MSSAVRVTYGPRETERALLKGETLIMVNPDGALSIEVYNDKFGVRLRLSKDESQHHKEKLLRWAKS